MKELTQYYRQISAWLPCGMRLKKQLMANIRTTVDNYLAEHQGIDFAELQAHFGTPLQIATAFVDEMDTSQLLQSLKIRKRIIRVVFLGAIIALALWTVVLMSIWANDAFGNGVTNIIPKN